MAKKKAKIDKTAIMQVLEQIPAKDLRTFVGKIINEQIVKTKFLKQFESYFIAKESADAYVEQIDDAYYDAEGDYGYIEFSKQSELSRKIDDVLSAADTFRDNGNYEAAVTICFEVLRHNVDVINNCDDSCGYLGGIMDRALDSLNSLVDPDVCTIDEEGREAFMDECWSCLEDNIFDGWDWVEDMYDFLSDLANDDDEYAEIIEAMDKDPHMQKDFYQRRMMSIKQRVLEKWHGEEAGEKFLLNNLQIQEFRERAIKKAIDSGDLERAYQLCRDGIIQDEKEKPGIVPTWWNWMLRTAQKENNKDVIIEYASLLYLDQFNIQGDFYKLLKETVPAEQWHDFTLHLAEQAKSSNHKERYADICAREGWTDKLYEYVYEDKSIYTLVHYEAILKGKYSKELVEMYIKYAYNLMTSYNRSRKTYQEMCSYLTRACNIGGRDRVNEAKDDLHVKYKACRALIDELSRV